MVNGGLERDARHGAIAVLIRMLGDWLLDDAIDAMLLKLKEK